MCTARATIIPITILALIAGSLGCDRSATPSGGKSPEATQRRFPITDTDSDGMDDDWETTHFGNLSRNGTGDYDSDGMTDLEEYQNDFDPTVDDGFDDADGDRYPNVFEVRNSGDPNDPEDLPTPMYEVNVAGGGDYTTIGGAITAATTSNGNYQIIHVAPGTYSGAGNINLSVASTKPKLLILGTAGAASTIVDGLGSSPGWTLSQSSVVGSLTFQRTTRAFYVNASGKHVRLVDLLLRANAYTGSNAGGVHVANVSKLYLVGCTLLENTSTTGSAQQLYLTNGTTYLTNTVIYGTSSSAHLWKHATNATLNPTYSLAKGYTHSGTGNLSSSTDPKLHAEGRLLYDSPLRAAGGTDVQSLLDLDLEERPGSSPDIGVDQFVDTDDDDLPDFWELVHAEDLEEFTGLAQDYDSDGLDNEEEYQRGTGPADSDSDDDGVSDGLEVNTHSTDPLDSDSDDDEMPDGWEVDNGLAPTVVDCFDDADGDRYPNVFEYAGSTDPQDDEDTPSATYTVDPGGGGTHTTVNSAISAANVSNGSHQIIHLVPGTYSGSSNLATNITSTKPKLLILGVGGAANTVIDGGDSYLGWTLQQDAALGSLTFVHTNRALYVGGANTNVVLDDMIVRNNDNPNSYGGGVHVLGADSVEVRGCTFLDNTSASGPAQQLYLGDGTIKLERTVVYGASSSAALWKHASNATLEANYSLVKGYTLSGTGNLSNATDPKLRFDGRLHHDSPLRDAGGTLTNSQLDIDLETRPGSSPDIGADQWIDDDTDDLPDAWELLTVYDLETLDGADFDGDDLTDLEEYETCNSERSTDPTNPDTDGDWIVDGEEVLAGTDPFTPDNDALTGDLNQDGVIDSLGVQLGYGLTSLDDDGDGLSNALELVMGTDPLSSDSDGDGTADAADAFPLDPLVHALGTNPEDTTEPVITLATPVNAELVEE